MNPPVLTFFNNKGGVGKTSLIYHLAWMFVRLGKKIVIADLDPQANLTASFLNEDAIEKIWNDRDNASTVFRCVEPLTSVGDIIEPILQNIAKNLYLLPGDVELSRYEDTLSNEWPAGMNDSNLYRPMKILSSFWQVVQLAAKQVQADIILVDIGPNLGAINRSVLIATDFVAVPLGADLFSLQGLQNLGPALRSWHKLWQRRLDNWNQSPEKNKYTDFHLPQGKMQSIGYLCQQYSVRHERPVKAYDKWVNRIPNIYRKDILEEESIQDIKQTEDPYCLATIKHYRSLIPMAQECRKPIFDLTSADGAIGAHANAVQDAGKDFKELAIKIAEKIGISINTSN